jgi:hypothetical protein
MSFFRNIFLRAALFASLLAVAPTGAARAEGTVNPSGLGGPEQRVALVIGNSNYRNVSRLPNPANDAKSIAELLNTAGFEVISATDLNHNEMVQVVQDFSGKIASRGPNTVAMVYYAGHGVQLAGENYLVPVDANISSEPDLVNGSVRLVDVMATLETIPSRMRIVVLDACRNNPFPSLDEASRGLAIVDAPNGSIVGYSTAPGSLALDGGGDHSPYASAFLKLAHEKNLPIEQLFKRIRLDVNNSTDGRQTPWESSSLTSDFYFFGDTAVAATRAPSQVKTAFVASDLPSRAVRQAYDYVLAEGSVEYYEEFIRFYPHDPLCDRVRALLGNLVQAKAWHSAVVANSPLAYKSFYDKFSNSPYAQTALKLEAKPKIVSLSQPTQIIVPSSFKTGGLGISKDNFGPNLGAPGRATPQLGNVSQGGLGTPTVGKAGLDKPGFDKPGNDGQIVTLPPASTKVSSDNKGPGKVVTLPGGGVNKIDATQGSKVSGEVVRVDGRPAKPVSQVKINQQPVGTSQPNATQPKIRRDLGVTKVDGNARMASTQSRGSALQSQGRFGGKFMR